MWLKIGPSERKLTTLPQNIFSRWGQIYQTIATVQNCSATLENQNEVESFMSQFDPFDTTYFIDGFCSTF
jgi:hypothetical protein